MAFKVAMGWGSLLRRSTDLAPLALGVLAALLIVGVGGMDPENVRWCCSGDCATHQLGWEFFRRSPWTFPLGMNPSYGLELGSSIFYSDSIPLLAFVFKPFRALLSERFQYLGLWVGLGLVLQSWFAWKILGRFEPKPSALVRCLALGLFVFAPPMLIRIDGHTALSSHWLILAALYLDLGDDRPRPLAWPALALAASLVHSYLFVMVLGLWLAHLVRRLFAPQTRFTRLGVEAAGVLLLSLLGLWQAGFFAIRAGSVGGYGALAMNLLAPLNPGLYSYFLPPVSPPRSGFHEGYNFLGFGNLLLVPVIALALFKQPALRRWPRRHGPLALLLLGFTAFALSNHLQIGDWSHSIPLPEKAYELASVLRSSGRMFWPVYYALIIAGVGVVVRGYRPWLAASLLALASLAQISDTRAGWGAQHRSFERRNESVCKTPLRSDFWAASARRYKTLRRMLPRNQPDDYDVFATFAATHGMATDSAYLARVDPSAAELALRDAEDTIAGGAFDPSTLYILDAPQARDALETRDRDADLLARVDGFYVLAPGWKKTPDPSAPADLDRLALAPGVKLERSVWFSPGDAALAYLERGWSEPTAEGVRASQASATLSIPIDAVPAGLRVELDVQAPLDPNQPARDIECWINGAWSAILQPDSAQAARWRSLPVPDAALQAAQESTRLKVVLRAVDTGRASGGDNGGLNLLLRRARLTTKE